MCVLYYELRRIATTHRPRTVILVTRDTFITLSSRLGRFPVHYDIVFENVFVKISSYSIFAYILRTCWKLQIRVVNM